MNLNKNMLTTEKTKKRIINQDHSLITAENQSLPEG
jgi:hypothetical protein